MLADHSHPLVTQLPYNLIWNIGYFLVNLIIGLILVPFFISTLGVAAYGIIPLATSITGYVAIIVQSLNTSVSRFLTIDIQREDYSAANITFSTAFFGISTIILLMVPVVFVISFIAPSIFNVPSGQETEIILLFLGVCFAVLLRTWSGNFTVQLFAFNRLDLLNLVNIINIIVQTALIIILFTVFGPRLSFIGEAYLIGAISASGVSIILAKKICPYLQVSIHSFNRGTVKDLCWMGWWVIIDQIGSLLFLQIDLIVVNLLFGATSAGEYAIALQWMVLMRGIAGVLTGVLTPIVLTFYAKDQIKTLIRVTKSAVKLMGLAMALPIGLVCGFAPQILTLWVGRDFTFLAPLMVILTIHLALNLAVLPLFSINVAFNKVRLPGILTFFMGVANCILAIVLSLFTDLGYYGVAIAGAIVLTIKNALFTPWYATRILNVAVNTFTRSMLPGIAATILIILFSILIRTFFIFTTLATLAIAFTLITLVYLIVLWKLSLDKCERRLFESYLPANIRRIIQ